MTESHPEKKIIVIPAKNESPQEQAKKRNLRVAAYCRVSTGDEEQLTSYENQKAFYTEKIMKNPEWTMVDIFADEGITGTSTCRRKDFLRMIRQCRQGKIDMILAKSVSRFARNTLDRAAIHRPAERGRRCGRRGQLHCTVPIYLHRNGRVQAPQGHHPTAAARAGSNRPPHAEGHNGAEKHIEQAHGMG